MIDELFNGLTVLPGIFDTHAHYDDNSFLPFNHELLDRLKQEGISGIVTCGCDISSSENALALAEKFSFVYAAAGYHPENIEGKLYEEDKLIKLLNNKKTVAIGEIGLDYHWQIDKSLQKEFFVKQLELSKKLNLPVIVHDREAHADTLEILQKYKPKGVVHCFSGSKEMAKEIIKIGMYIGIGGVVTFKNARKTAEVADYLPLDRLLLETDCPYLAPEPFRGKICHSGYITMVAQKLAEIKGTSAQNIIDLSCDNAKTLFNIK